MTFWVPILTLLIKFLTQQVTWGLPTLFLVRVQKRQRIWHGFWCTCRVVSSPTASTGCNSVEKQDAVSYDIYSQQGGVRRTAALASGCEKISQTGAPHTPRVIFQLHAFVTSILLDISADFPTLFASTWHTEHIKPAKRCSSSKNKKLYVWCRILTLSGIFLSPKVKIKIFQGLTQFPSHCSINTSIITHRTSFYTLNPIRS